MNANHSPRRTCLTLMLAGLAGALPMAQAQSALTYQQPPAPIADILDAPAPPGLLLSPDMRLALESQRRLLPPIAELAAPAVETAGLRLNPATDGQMDQPCVDRMTLVDLESLERRPLDLPEDLRAFDLRWSPDSRRLAWCRITANGTELWLTETESGASRRLGALTLNSALDSPLAWLPDGSGLLCLRVPAGRGAPPLPEPPEGPVVLENDGRTAAARTQPFLINSRHDERLFEHHAAAELVEVGLDGGERLLLPPAIVLSFSVSPDGGHVLLETAQGPWSRSLPVWEFAKRVFVVDRDGRERFQLADLPPADLVSIRHDAERPGPRRAHWRADAPATLCWVEALDGGDPEKPAAERDALWLLPAPFDGKPRELARLADRFAALVWGRPDLALVWESWHEDHRQRIWKLDPASGRKSLLLERDSEDAWTEPGWPLTARNELGRTVLRVSADGKSIFWSGRGVGEQGPHPYLDRMRLRDGRRERLWECRDPWYESVLEMLDDQGGRLLLNRESQDEPPNAWLWERPAKGALPAATADGRARRVTGYTDPAPLLAGLQKEVLRYQRADGVDLSATLYLPPGYRRGVDPPLPAVLWVYPREFKSRDAAGRVTASGFTFSRPSGISVLFLLTQGYAVVSDPALPILGEKGAKANDSYLEQLEAGARAAVEHLATLGTVDTSRLAIGGHSYGAFTAANLLAHTDWFRTAICFSGAYNRTLTPFGFQGEDRSFWEAPATYQAMSPFNAADRIKRPILLVHGTDDPNQGTFPLQSDRFYEALKGLGAQARLVRLPAEGHGYRARESVGHVLWEMITWCDEHLKADTDGAESPARPAR